MKLWKILLATMIALVLVCAVATAECAHEWKTDYLDNYKTEKYSASQHVITADDHQFCTKCGDTKVVDYAKYVDHDFSNFLNHVDRTCTTNGYDVYKCDYCGETKNYNGTAEKNQATGHSPVSKYTAGTCLEKAKNEHYCQYCGIETAATEYGGLGDHDYEITGTVAPTCEEKGYNVYVCSICGDEKHWDLKDAAHKYEKGEVVAPTCTEKGYTIYTCSACGDEKHWDATNAKHDKVSHAKVEATCGAPGHWDYVSCKNCDVLWTSAGTVVNWSALVIPVNSNLHEYNEYNGWKTSVEATCTLNGEEYIQCIHCGHKVTRTIETKGHTYASVSKLQGKAAGVVAGIGYVTTPSQCTVDGAGWLECTVCQEMTKSVTIPAHGHAWGAWEYSARATCTTNMTATRKCGWNGAHTETKVVAEATGHAWQVLAGTDATCTEEGTVTRYCPACDTKEENKKVAALGHKYEWVTVVEPSMAGSGKNAYTCKVCGDVAKTETVKYHKYYYNNTMTSFGPTTKELVGGNDWYRVTPVDVSVDGVYTYDLIASNRYVVGSVTITVNAGVLTVSYDVASSHIDVKDEALYIYASKADLAAGTAVTANVGAAINVAETFGADTKVIVSLVLTGDYDAAGHNVSAMIIDDAEVAAMIANVD